MNNLEYKLDERDIEYQRQAGKAWLVRIYQPKGTGPFPTIIDVHGGAWHNGDRTNNAGIDRALAPWHTGIGPYPRSNCPVRPRNSPSFALAA